jgi:hypothetical protein
MAIAPPHDGEIRRFTVNNHPELVDVYRYSLAAGGWLYEGQERKGELPEHLIAQIDQHVEPDASRRESLRRRKLGG